MSALPPILALDLATKTGWAFLAAGAERPESGVLKLADGDRSERIVSLEAWLWPRLAPLGGGRGVLVYEEPTLARLPGGFRNANGHRVAANLEACVLRLAQSWGVARVCTLTPAEVKKHATGKGNADKAAVVAAMRERWLVEPRDDNEADALALLGWAVDRLNRGAVA